MAERLRKRSVVLAGHRTSVSLEPEFWDALKAIGQAQKLSLNRLIEEIDRTRTQPGEDRPSAGLSSAVRIYVLRRLQEETRRA